MKDLNSTKIGKLYRLVIYTRWRYHKTSLHTHRIPGNGFRTSDTDTAWNSYDPNILKDNLPLKRGNN